MKLKNLFISFACLCGLTLLASCVNPNGSSSDVVVDYFTDGNVVLEDSSLTVDPSKITYIAVHFSEKMDTNYGVYAMITYNWSNNDFYYDNSYWKNDRTLFIATNLRYDADYKIVFNDSTYDVNNEDGYKDRFLRTKNGKKLKEFSLEFSTIPSPTVHPHDYVITNYTKFSTKFAKNEYNDPVNQQVVITNLRPFLNHDVLKKGDTLTFKYDITSPYDLHNIKANLVDTNFKVNYWKMLTTDSTGEKGIDLVIVDDLPANTQKTGSITFTITEDMERELSLQLFADYDSTTNELYSIEFAAVSEPAE